MRWPIAAVPQPPALVADLLEPVVGEAVREMSCCGIPITALRERLSRDHVQNRCFRNVDGDVYEPHVAFDLLRTLPELARARDALHRIDTAAVAGVTPVVDLLRSALPASRVDGNSVDT